jgi:hypothetical protein
MAEGHRMIAADLVDKLMADEHADVTRLRQLHAQIAESPPRSPGWSDRSTPP